MTIVKFIVNFLLGLKSESDAGEIDWPSILSAIRDAAIVVFSAAAVQFLEHVDAVDFGSYDALVAGAIGLVLAALRRFAKSYKE